ncbi:MAG: hypothetical protein QNL93_03140 [Opitutae bacterium]
MILPVWFASTGTSEVEFAYFCLSRGIKSAKKSIVLNLEASYPSRAPLEVPCSTGGFSVEIDAL